MIPRRSGRRPWANILDNLALKSVLFIHRPKALFLLLSGLAGGVLLSLNSCSSQPRSITISSGIVGSYYNRLAEQIDHSSKATVKLSVQNFESQGSQQNIESLLAHKVDFAIAQLDVANEVMRQGKVKAVAVLANEYVHIITRQDSGLKTFTDLKGKRVAIGTSGSGMSFTAKRLLKADNISVQPDYSSFDEAFKKLKSRQVDAVIYVGSLGASKNLRRQFVNNPDFRLLPIEPALINHLTVFDPGSYHGAELPVGTYTSLPPIPDQKVLTLSTPTVLVTRPEMNRPTVALVTWSILSTARTYSQFYPALQNEEPKNLLRKGLFYIHPAAEEVLENGDPRMALMRYWENNNDLQSTVVILVTTSVVGLLLRQWRRQRSKKMVTTTTNRINELKSLLPDHPQQALDGIEDLSQEHRLMFVEGAVTTEVYEQLRHKTQTFTDQCRRLLEQQRKKFVMETLLLLDEWQVTLQSDPEAALQKLSYIKQQYRDMLLSDQVDIDAYMELMQLTLISLMTLVPKNSHNGTNFMKQNQTLEVNSNNSVEP
ncbi:TAXI family TRAP transporter solute-binding subunit [Mastigocladopsis repens]|uniref:TAXI family TRAP transporter solute-binding subunit n=1 Tax=Mastigocladopsis repens TaxID=221287 RepID=UPI0003806541|nr:TAXI family TRAP transporter solute-binding subunit [Mastigocladopsis repens]